MESDNTPQKSRRFKKLFIFILLAATLVTRFIVDGAVHSSAPTRRFVIIGAMALLMLPIGYICGLNATRKDNPGQISRFIFVLMVLGICLGFSVEGPWKLIFGIGGGHLAGHFLGWVIHRKKTGDALEGDEATGVVKSVLTPPKEHPCESYLKSQDSETRRVIWTLRIVELLMAFGAIVLGLVPAFADWLDILSRAVFVRPGDGTLFFITNEPIIIGVPLIMLSICVWGFVSELLLPVIAGPRKDVWLEFKKLRSGRTRSGFSNKPIVTYAFVVFVIVLASTVALFVHSFVRVTHDGIEISRFWGLRAKSYTWTEMQSIDIHYEPYICRSCGQQHQRLYAKVIFADGTEWKPDTSFSRRELQIENAVRYASEQKR